MKTKIIYLLTACWITFSSCKENKSDYSAQIIDKNLRTVQNEWNDLFREIPAENIQENPIDIIGNEWMLVTAGDSKKFNSMTVSWGGWGEVWNKPCSFIFIRDVRYTYEFLEQKEGFTLCFFPEEFKGALRILGNRSGRNQNKIKQSGLQYVLTPSGLVAYKEAKMIIECKKLFTAPLQTENISKNVRETIVKDWYTSAPSLHNLFISEITKVWIKKHL